MSTFLELWNDKANNLELPSIDESFLVLAANYAANSGEGQYLHWITAITATYGAIPQGARSANGLRWPYPNWQSAHYKGLLNNLKTIILGKFEHTSYSSNFTPKEFLDENIKINFNGAKFYRNSTKEAVAASSGDGDNRIFREATENATESRIVALGSKAGINMNYTDIAGEQLYDYTKKQLLGGRPVLSAINTGLTKNAFSEQTAIGSGHLVNLGTGSNGHHMVVALGICDGKPPLLKGCTELNKDREDSQIPECIVYQNSWGTDVHSPEFNYFCLSRKAAERVLTAILYLPTTNESNTPSVSETTPSPTDFTDKCIYYSAGACSGCPSGYLACTKSTLTKRPYACWRKGRRGTDDPRCVD